MQTSSNMHLAFVFACGPKNDTPEVNIQNTRVDCAIRVTEIEEGINMSDLQDSLSRIDTSDLPGKRQYIFVHFIVETPPCWPGYDSLLDLNYDGYDDYIIGYYGTAGTGLKNAIEVYIYNHRIESYVFDTTLSRLPNPSFFLQQKKITSFYIAHGCGYGSKLEWKKEKWIATKEFSVCNEGDSSKWEITYPLTDKSDTIIRPYQMIPPDDILETIFEW